MWGAEAGNRAADLRRRLREVEGTAGPGALVSLVEGAEVTGAAAVRLTPGSLPAAIAAIEF
eukprot:6389898-Alexandrium_andersonii.AAC.1